MAAWGAQGRWSRCLLGFGQAGLGEHNTGRSRANTGSSKQVTEYMLGQAQDSPAFFSVHLAEKRSSGRP